MSSKSARSEALRVVAALSEEAWAALRACAVHGLDPADGSRGGWKPRGHGGWRITPEAIAELERAGAVTPSTGSVVLLELGVAIARDRGWLNPGKADRKGGDT